MNDIDGRYVFVCSGNKVRSPRVARWFHLYSHIHGLDTRVRSAGMYVPLEDERFGMKRLDQPLVDWADLVVVMEEKMRDHYVEWFKKDNVYCANIPDIFGEIPAWADVEFVDPVPADAALRLYQEHGYKYHFSIRSLSRVLAAQYDTIVGEGRLRAQGRLAQK
jgi:predicted protein tyrosine phosphatase